MNAYYNSTLKRVNRRITITLDTFHEITKAQQDTIYITYAFRLKILQNYMYIYFFSIRKRRIAIY